MNIVMGEEEIGIRGGEDDDFGGRGVVLGEGIDEGGNVGSNFIIPDIDGRIVDSSAGYAPICCESQGAVAWGGGAGVKDGSGVGKGKEKKRKEETMDDWVHDEVSAEG